MSVGEKLRQLRGEQSQRDVARRLDVTPSAYAMYERDERVPRDEIKRKIAKLYGKSVGEIFFAQ